MLPASCAAMRPLREHNFIDNQRMGLEVAFRSIELRSTCESPARAKRELGDDAAAVLRGYLADLEAVETVAELLDMTLGFEVCEAVFGRIRVLLSEGQYLYCEVNHQHVPTSEEKVNWALVSRLKIIHIGGSL